MTTFTCHHILVVLCKRCVRLGVIRSSRPDVALKGSSGFLQGGYVVGVVRGGGGERVVL